MSWWGAGNGSEAQGARPGPRSRYRKNHGLAQLKGAARSLPTEASQEELQAEEEAWVDRATALLWELLGQPIEPRLRADIRQLIDHTQGSRRLFR